MLNPTRDNNHAGLNAGRCVCVSFINASMSPVQFLEIRYAASHRNLECVYLLGILMFYPLFGGSIFWVPIFGRRFFSGVTSHPPFPEVVSLCPQECTRARVRGVHHACVSMVQFLEIWYVTPHEFRFVGRRFFPGLAACPPLPGMRCLCPREHTHRRV